MPAKLPEPMTRVTWRVPSADLDLLTVLHGENVNGFIRELVAAYCRRLRGQMGGTGTSGRSAGTGTS